MSPWIAVVVSHKLSCSQHGIVLNLLNLVKSFTAENPSHKPGFLGFEWFNHYFHPGRGSKMVRAEVGWLWEEKRKRRREKISLWCEGSVWLDLDIRGAQLTPSTRLCMCNCAIVQFCILWEYTTTNQQSSKKRKSWRWLFFSPKNLAEKVLTIQYKNTNIHIQKYKYTILNLKTVMIITN